MINVGALSFADEEELEAYFDEQLFEIKKELLQKPLLRATMKSRLKKLEQLEEIERILKIVVSGRDLTLPEIPNFNALSIPEQWKQFASIVSKWKLTLSASSTIESLKETIETGFELWKTYCSTIPDFEWTEEDPKVGIVENVMVLQDGFRWMEENQVASFEELHKKHHTNEQLKMFFVELKRLSLRVPYL